MKASPIVFEDSRYWKVAFSKHVKRSRFGLQIVGLVSEETHSGGGADFEDQAGAIRKAYCANAVEVSREVFHVGDGQA